MSQSLTAIYVHLIFSTKHRKPFLEDPGLLTETHEFLGSVSTKLGHGTVNVGGMADHVHLLARLSRTQSIADWVRELKRKSCIWIRGHQSNTEAFGWQDGYGAFSVNASNLAAVDRYIANQETHHRAADFKTEFRAILRSHGVIWDERYVWG